MIVSVRVAKLLQKLGYNVACIDEYWTFENSPINATHPYLEGEYKKIPKNLRISAPTPYQALEWLWEHDLTRISLVTEREKPIARAKIKHNGMEIEISGDSPGCAIYNCLELIERSW